MPTLKLISTLAAEEKISCGKVTRKKVVTADDSFNNDDDRFSQTPDEKLVESRKKQSDSSNGLSNTASAFSIASAIRNYRNRHNPHDRKVNENETKAHTSASSTTDIVAVVLSAAIRQDPLPSKAAKINGGSSSRMHLLIGDGTLPTRGQCARVSMFVASSQISSTLASLLGVDGLGCYRLLGTDDASQMKGNPHTTWRLGQLQPGDVVRWNRLEVRNDYGDKSMLGKKRKSPNSSNPDEDNNSSDRHHPDRKSVV